MKCVLRSESGNLRQKLAQSLTIGSLSMLALMATVVPNVSQLFPESAWSQRVHAQTQSAFTPEEIRNYARAVLGMEPRRQVAYDEIKSIVGDTVPVVVCSQSRSINQLKQNVRAIAVNYCAQAKAIIESNALTISQFNEITQRQQSDSQLKQQIQSELLRLQQNLEN